MKFAVQLLHNTKPTFECPKTMSDLRPVMDNYKEVHEFEIEADTARDACEIVFERSQNVYDSWKEPNRSTSVGDVMMIMGIGVYAVDRIGMRDLLANGVNS